MKRSDAHLSPSSTRQSGVALAISLMLLVVIALGSATAMRSGLFGSLVANNMRANQLAVQAAETALRYCENLVTLDPPGIAIQALPVVNVDTPVLWANLGSWSGNAPLATTLPNAVINSALATVTYAQAPQCLVEQMELRRTHGQIDELALVITARGFSPDFRPNQSGAEVWLQSTLRFTP